MLVKWITCVVVDRPGFDRGQRRWEALRAVPGFVGQVGGWSVRDPATAHVFAFWASRTDHERFLAGLHDGLAAAQAGTFARIRVRLFDQRLAIREPFRPRFAEVGQLRVAHCLVHPQRVEHFTDAQAKVWNPGMGGAPGMLGGVFAQAAGAEFLVLSMWASAADHEAYRTQRFAELRRRAGAAEDLAEVVGDLVEVERAWSVARDSMTS
jgi:heme-degrading monooxygenase HmoA